MSQFQSSPDPKAGRNFSACLLDFWHYWFQSSPDPKAGRNAAEKAKLEEIAAGSNPRPTRRPGAT